MNVGIYKTEKYTAYLYPTKIVISTRLQAFKVVQDRSNESLINDMKLSILRGDIKRIDELRDYEGKLEWLNCSKPQLQHMD